MVVNFGAADLLEANLVWTSAGDCRSQVKVYVVDNHSTESNRRSVAALSAREGWQLLGQPSNPGFGYAVNLGFERAIDDGCDVLVSLNPDARLAASALDDLAQAARQEPSTMICPRIVGSDGAIYFDGSQLDLSCGRLGRKLPNDLAPQMAWLTGACLAISSYGWRRLGGFDDDYFLYWEDVDLSYRAISAGLDLLVRHDIEAVHDEGGTHGSGGRRKSDIYYRYNCRNRLVFAAKNLSISERLRWLLWTPRESLLIYLRGGKRQLLESPSGALAALSGTLAGAAICLRSILRAATLRPKPAP